MQNPSRLPWWTLCPASHSSRPAASRSLRRTGPPAPSPPPTWTTESTASPPLPQLYRIEPEQDQREPLPSLCSLFSSVFSVIRFSAPDKPPSRRPIVPPTQTTRDQDALTVSLKLF